MKSGKHYLLLTVLFIGFSFPLILTSDVEIFDSMDETAYHYPTVKQFSEQFPHLDLVNYKLAMTPLYPIILMLFMKLFSLDLIGLRIINFLVSLGCVLLLYKYLSRHLTRLGSLLLSMCIMFSPYFLGASIRLSTETTGLLIAIGVLMLLEKEGGYISRKFLLASILATVCVLTRQVYVWLALAGIYSALFHGEKITNIIKMRNGLFFILPIVSLLPFYLLWGGVTTPVFTEKYYVKALPNIDVLAYVVALLGLMGIFFILWYYRYFKENGGKWWYVIIIVILSWLFLILYPLPDAYKMGTGGGALWKLATYFPSVASTSVIFWILIPLGLFFGLAIFLNRVVHRDYFILVCLLLWVAANMMSGQTYEKYYDPFLLLFLGYTLKGIPSVKSYYWVGPAVLALSFIVVDVFRCYL